MTQYEINQWEIENFDKFTGWEITYLLEFDVIKFLDGKIVISEFKRYKI